MGWTTPPRVSYCRTGGYTFFLDTGRDRYFALGAVADAVLARLSDGGPPCAEDNAIITRLVGDGLLVATADGTSPQPCRHDAAPLASALDASTAFAAVSVLSALARLGHARLSLRFRGLAATLETLKRRKAKLRRGRALLTDLVHIAAAFERCNAIATPLDQCLPRSIAVAHRLIDCRIEPTLVIGVRAQPFAAHCWVVSENLLVNDRHDTVRAFAPILAL